MNKETAILDFESSAISLEFDAEPQLYVQGSPSRLRREEERSVMLQIPVFLKSLGSDRAFEFVTYEVSATGLFVICRNLAKYPFKINTTLLNAVLKCVFPGTNDVKYISLLTKIDSHSPQDPMGGPEGFKLKIVQATFEDRSMLDLLLQAASS